MQDDLLSFDECDQITSALRKRLESAGVRSFGWERGASGGFTLSIRSRGLVESFHTRREVLKRWPDLQRLWHAPYVGVV